jgi:hypothetical protein
MKMSRDAPDQETCRATTEPEQIVRLPTEEE